MRIARVVKTTHAGRECWGVQRYVEGSVNDAMHGYRPRFRLAQKFWKKSDAVGYAALVEMQLADVVLVDANHVTQ